MLRSDLSDYSDAYVAVKGFVTVSANVVVNKIRDKTTDFQHLKKCSIYFLYFKNKWCSNAKCRRFRCWNATVHFA